MSPQKNPQDLFRSRVYDILANQNKLLPTANKIGVLTPDLSAVYTAICLAMDQLLEDSAMELAEVAVDGIALTLLAIHRDGLVGQQLANPNLQKIADLLLEIRHDKAEGHPA